MTIGSLFSGIGGLELGLERAGFGPVLWQVEIDPFCRSILAKHWPDAERHEDVRAVGASLPRVDLICGGFPCQDVSSAGNRAGLAGSRSGLWREFARVVSEVRPEWVVVENVASGAKLWLDAVVRDLGERGYACLPIPLSAAGVGAPHLRRRIFVVAYAERELVRQQPGRVSRSSRPGARELADAREKGPATNADARRQHALAVDTEVAFAPEPARDAEGSRLEKPDDRHSPRETHSSPAWARIGFAGSGWRAPEPCLRRVDDGLPRAMDRLRALGNAVVPQCAEVVGHVIRELMEPAKEQEASRG